MRLTLPFLGVKISFMISFIVLEKIDAAYCKFVLVVASFLE